MKIFLLKLGAQVLSSASATDCLLCYSIKWQIRNNVNRENLVLSFMKMWWDPMRCGRPAYSQIW